MSGRQCELRLWNEVFNRDLKEDPDPVTQDRFDTGTEVGELAQKRYPGGRLIAHDHLHFREAYEETKELLNDLSIPALFEPAFQHRRVRCRVDVLQRLPRGGWKIVEVKSTKSLKPQHLEDIALQYWVLKGANFDVRDASVLTLNPDYVRGKRLNVNKLFKEHSVWEEVQQLATSIRSEVEFMKRMLAGDTAPNIAMGNHCTKPYTCPFFEHCSIGLPVIEHPITELHGLRENQLDELFDLGIEEIKDVPEDYDLNEISSQIRKSVSRGRAMWRKQSELRDQIARMSTPVRHLDFETICPAIPQFEGTGPFLDLPFMFSVHTESRDGSLRHSDYLHREATDPRRCVAEQLIEKLGKVGSICMYSYFERTQIKNLAKAFPDLEESLLGILKRLVDIRLFVLKHYYHPDFRGSFSLKSVYPVLGTSDYSDLEIAEGSLASIEYLHALNTEDSEERERIFRNLREYCRRDTLATHEILGRLRRQVGL